MLNWVEYEKSFITLGPDFVYLFCTQLSGLSQETVRQLTSYYSDIWLHFSLVCVEVSIVVSG